LKQNKKEAILLGKSSREELKSIEAHLSEIFCCRPEQNRMAVKPAQASGYIQSVRCGEELRISNSTILLAQTSRHSPVVRHRTETVEIQPPSKKKGKNKLSLKHEIKMKCLSKKLTQ